MRQVENRAQRQKGALVGAAAVICHWSWTTNQVGGKKQQQSNSTVSALITSPKNAFLKSPVRLSNIPAESSSESSQVSSSRKKEKRASSRLSSTRKGSISQE